MQKNNRSLATLSKDLVKEAFKGIEEELGEEHLLMIRDYVKGMYRLRNDYEKQVKEIEIKIEEIDNVLDQVEKGNADLEKVKTIAVPAKYLSEKTVRMANMSWDE